MFAVAANVSGNIRKLLQVVALQKNFLCFTSGSEPEPELEPYRVTAPVPAISTFYWKV
jgi:hypothetical protein